jgi:hypothetical protein
MLSPGPTGLAAQLFINRSAPKPRHTSFESSLLLVAVFDTVATSLRIKGWLIDTFR